MKRTSKIILGILVIIFGLPAGINLLNYLFEHDDSWYKPYTYWGMFVVTYKNIGIMSGLCVSIIVVGILLIGFFLWCFGVIGNDNQDSDASL